MRKLILLGILWILGTMAIMAMAETVVSAPPEQAQVSSVCRVLGPANTMNFHVTVSSSQNLSGTTGVLTGTGPSGPFTVSLSFDSKGGGSYNGTAVLAAGQYTITAGTVGLPTYTIPVHNVPFVFGVPTGTPNCATAVSLESLGARTTIGGIPEDHIRGPLIGLVTALGTVGLAILARLAWIYRPRRVQ